ncbi:unnamed protein product [Phytophthora fragariaefolia]|uniref:Unnamed protein product n=1 Tax=Phytophthora fragariaefolia TaxID=1490495 RepID=A0A9W6XJP2_9STRA|nr:unnamed protein product [Phytophthora fragariaefolia]
MKDDMSGFCELIVCEDPTAESACRSLMDWFIRLVPDPQWVSDRVEAAFIQLAVLPLVQSALNQTPSDQLGGEAAVTAFTALPASPPVVAILHLQTDEVVDVQVVYRKQRQHVDSVQATLEGPRRVVGATNDHIFQFQDLSAPFHVAAHHASRPRLYADADREVTEDLVARATHGDGGHLVAKMLECRRSQESHVWEILVELIGLDPLEASWKLAVIMYEDVPQLVEKFVKDQAAD